MKITQISLLSVVLALSCAKTRAGQETENVAGLAGRVPAAGADSSELSKQKEISSAAPRSESEEGPATEDDTCGELDWISEVLEPLFLYETAENLFDGLAERLPQELSSDVVSPADTRRFVCQLLDSGPEVAQDILVGQRRPTASGDDCASSVRRLKFYPMPTATYENWEVVRITEEEFLASMAQRRGLPGWELLEPTTVLKAEHGLVWGEEVEPVWMCPRNSDDVCVPSGIATHPVSCLESQDVPCDLRSYRSRVAVFDTKNGLSSRFGWEQSEGLPAVVASDEGIEVRQGECRRHLQRLGPTALSGPDPG